MRLSLSNLPLYYILFDPILLSLEEKPMNISLIEPQKDLYFKAWKTMKLPLLWDRGTIQKGRETNEEKWKGSKEFEPIKSNQKEKGSKSQSKRKRNQKKRAQRAKWKQKEKKTW